MQSIQQLHDAADKERQKATDLRQLAEKNRLKYQDNMADPTISLRYSNEAQKSEERAALHDQEAMKFETKATDLEAKALEINRQKVELQNNSQAQILKLDQEEKKLRGQAA